MGFLANWFAGKSGASFATTSGLMPSAPTLPQAPRVPHTAHGSPSRQGAQEKMRALESALALQRALDALGSFEPARGGAHPPIRDYTTQPTIDPSELSKIMPRNGECKMAVSGLDGVLTIGKDMTMTTDQPIFCQTLRVLGTLEATVQAHKLIIAEGARVMGSVRANEAEIYGEFDGSLQVRGAVSVFPGATVTGKVRATEISLSKQAKTADADIKRVVPKVLDGFDLLPVSEARFEDGYSSMSITVSQRSAMRL